MNKKTIIIISAAAFIPVALSVGTYFYFKNMQKPQEKILTPSTATIPEAVIDLSENATQGVLPSINTNPFEDKPDINPADKTNPFTNIETNPFK